MHKKENSMVFYCGQCPRISQPGTNAFLSPLSPPVPPLPKPSMPKQQLSTIGLTVVSYAARICAIYLDLSLHRGGGPQIVPSRVPTSVRCAPPLPPRPPSLPLLLDFQLPANCRFVWTATSFVCCCCCFSLHCNAFSFLHMNERLVCFSPCRRL